MLTQPFNMYGRDSEVSGGTAEWGGEHSGCEVAGGGAWGSHLTECCQQQQQPATLACFHPAALTRAAVVPHPRRCSSRTDVSS